MKLSKAALFQIQDQFSKDDRLNNGRKIKALGVRNIRQIREVAYANHFLVLGDLLSKYAADGKVLTTTGGK